jgi:hypothetical protein
MGANFMELNFFINYKNSITWHLFSSAIRGLINYTKYFTQWKMLLFEINASWQ